MRDLLALDLEKRRARRGVQSTSFGRRVHSRHRLVYYLYTILDFFSRKVVCWALTERQSAGAA